MGNSKALLRGARNSHVLIYTLHFLCSIFRGSRIKARLATVCLPGLLLLAPSAHAIPTIQHWQTTNGARVYFTPTPEIPIVDIRIVFDAGSARDGDKFGLASLTNGLLREGAGGLDADMIAQRLDNIGAQLGNGSLRDMAWLELRTLSEEKTLREAIELMSMVLSEPDFPEVAFRRDIKNILVSLQADKQNPGVLAEKAFMKAVYGDHPYAMPSQGTQQSIQAMTQKDVRTYYEKFYVARNAIIAIAGDVSRSGAEALAELLAGRLREGEPAARLQEVKPLQEAITIHVEHPSSQTHIWVGQPGMKRGDNDYLALYIGNHAFGGSGLVSLLSDEVREKRGYAYSAYSYFSPMRSLGPFAMVAQTKNDNVADALNVMKDTLRKFVKTGITSRQIKASKQNITGGFALRLDSNRKIVENLAVIGFYDLPLDYLYTFNDRVSAVTRQQVNSAFLRRIYPDRMVLVLVGPKNIRSDNHKENSKNPGERLQSKAQEAQRISDGLTYRSADT